MYRALRTLHSPTKSTAPPEDYNVDLSQEGPLLALHNPDEDFEIIVLLLPSKAAGKVKEEEHSFHANVWQTEWQIQRFGVRRYVEAYRFVNLDQVPLRKAFFFGV